MTRTELYSKIKEYELQNAIKAMYSMPYTNLSTATLIQIVDSYERNNTPNESICKLGALIKLLYDKHILCKSEYEMLVN